MNSCPPPSETFVECFTGWWAVQVLKLRRFELVQTTLQLGLDQAALYSSMANLATLELSFSIQMTHPWQAILATVGARFFFSSYLLFVCLTKENVLWGLVVSFFLSNKKGGRMKTNSTIWVDSFSIQMPHPWLAILAMLGARIFLKEFFSSYLLFLFDKKKMSSGDWWWVSFCQIKKEVEWKQIPQSELTLFLFKCPIPDWRFWRCWGLEFF